jgi:poly(A) polymerase
MYPQASTSHHEDHSVPNHAEGDGKSPARLNPRAQADDGRREPRIIPRQDHPISRKDIDKDTLHVLYKLKDANYESYLVGGAVRDLLIGRRPKDFDLATDARPNELKRLFRNSRVVGRRFKLVHVFFGPKNVEVATLRSMAEPAAPDEDLYIEEDNQWGDLESDAFRRDFTINALFYDIYDFAVIDYTGGVADLEAKIIRCIGDPRVRFQEDPVRMLRAIKFAARFGFSIEPATDAAIRALHAEIHKASRFRVTEEIFRILTQANRARGLTLLHDYGFLGDLYPNWLAAIGPDGLTQVQEFFTAVDERAEDEIYFPLEILTAGLFLPVLDDVDVAHDHFHHVASRVTGEVRQLGLAMDLPKRLINAAQELLRGQLYLLFFGHLTKRMHKYCSAPWFDLVWQLQLLAFGGMPELAEIQAAWRAARQNLGRPLGGTVSSPDRRDIFSFRGNTGGGRFAPGERPGPHRGPRRGGRDGGHDRGGQPPHRHDHHDVLEELVEEDDEPVADEATIDKEVAEWEDDNEAPAGITGG